jgi:hydroxyacylglutathione hydrolase
MNGFVDQEEAARLLEAGALVVDVRTLPEWQAGHGPEAVLMPLDQLEARVSELPKDRVLLMVCRSGARSGHAAAWLRQQGFDAHNLGPWQRDPRCGM